MVKDMGRDIGIKEWEHIGFLFLRRRKCGEIESMLRVGKNDACIADESRRKQSG